MEQNQFHHLGNKTLLLFFLRRSRIGIFVFILAGIAVFLTPSRARLTLDFEWTVFGISLIIFSGALLVSWFEYARYAITLNVDSIEVTRGVIHEEKIGIPYRRIEDVLIERGLLDQVIGTSSMFISVVGAEGDTLPKSRGSKVVFPALSAHFAETIQQELMRRANIEEIAVERPR